MFWSKAVQAGLSVDPTPPAWCVVLNCLHYGNKDPKNRGDNLPVPKELRYPLRFQSKMNGLSFPVAGEMLEGVRALRNLIDQALLYCIAIALQYSDENSNDPIHPRETSTPG